MDSSVFVPIGMAVFGLGLLILLVAADATGHLHAAVDPAMMVMTRP